MTLKPESMEVVSTRMHNYEINTLYDLAGKKTLSAYVRAVLRSHLKANGVE